MQPSFPLFAAFIRGACPVFAAFLLAAESGAAGVGKLRAVCAHALPLLRNGAYHLLSRIDVFTPDDIANVKLRRALVGGYKPSETRQYLHQIAWELSRVVHERGTFEEEARRYQAQLDRYERREELESASLSGAHAAARAIREEARRDAELVLKKAYKHASEVRANAEKEASSRLAEYSELEKKSRIMRTELRGLLASVLEALSEPTGDPPKQEERPVMDDLREAVKAAATPSVSELNPELTGRRDGQPTEGPGLPDEDADEWSGGERVA